MLLLKDGTIQRPTKRQFLSILIKKLKPLLIAENQNALIIR